MISPFARPSIVRLGPDLRSASTDPSRPRSAPLPPDRVAAIRKLVEETPLPYRAIARQTGVALATISRLAARHGWIRPPAAPKPNPTAAQRRSARSTHLSDRILNLVEDIVERMENGSRPVAPKEVHAAMRLLELGRRSAEEAERQKRKGRGKKAR